MFRAFFAPVGVIGLAHVVGGVSALAEPKAANVSGLAGMTDLGAEPVFTAFILIIVGVMAVVSRFCLSNRDATWALVAPQQILLMVQFGGIVVALSHGAYPDGYKPTDDWWGSFWFILADQSPLVAMCLAHTIEIALGGIPNEERAYYQDELRETQLALDRCNRCWALQSQSKFWEDIGNGPIAGPNVASPETLVWHNPRYRPNGQQH
jgi:hypothetical protein